MLSFILISKKFEQEEKDLEFIRNSIEKIIYNVNNTLPRELTIKQFFIISEPLTLEKGEILINGEFNRECVFRNYGVL